MDDKLVDVGALGPRLRYLAGALAALTLAAAVVDGLRNGLTFALLGRWAAVFAAALVVLTALLIAVQAVRGAGSAARRGERLTGSDVGLVPPRRSAGGDASPQDPRPAEGVVQGREPRRNPPGPPRSP